MRGIEIKITCESPEQVRRLMDAWDAIQNGEQTFQSAAPSEYEFESRELLGGGYTLTTPTVPAVQPVHHPEAATPAAQSVETDVVGLPWVDGTHSSSRKKNADGSWSIRKGCPDNLAQGYKSEFKRRMNGAPQAGVQNVPAPMPGAAFPAPAIDYETWTSQYMSCYGLLNSNPAVVQDMFRKSGVQEIHEFVTNATARQISYSIMKQLELA